MPVALVRHRRRRAHGHVHHTSDYNVGQCRVISNPRGYPGYEVNPLFDPKYEVEVSLEDYPISP